MNPNTFLVLSICLVTILAIVTLGMFLLCRSRQKSCEKCGDPTEERTAELARINEALRSEIRERKEIENALRASEEHFRQIFSTIPIPVWLYDLDTLKFLEVNDMATEKYGYSHEQFLTMTIEEMDPGEKLGLQKQISAQAARQFAQGRKHQTKDGRILDVEVSSHLTTFAGKAAVLVAVQDVSDRKQMEVELRHSQKLESVGSLAAGIAHEINTPIQFVGDNTRFLRDAFKGVAQLIETYEEACHAVQAAVAEKGLIEKVRQAREASDWEYMREEIPKALDQAMEGIARVAKIVRAMKEFSHVNQSAEKLAGDLNRALESTLIVARNELKYVADVKTDYGELPPVMCHLGDLNQVFLNLLINAAHAIGDVVKVTSKKGEINVRTRRNGDWAEVAISDTGTGIPKEIQQKIFDPFFTTKEVGKGTGQGLALAHAVVVDKHGGTLTFETEPGIGTTFYVRLPLNGVAAVQREPAPR